MQTLSTAEQKRLIEELGQLVAERAQAELTTQSSRDARLAALQTQCDAAQKRLEARISQEQAALQTQHNRALASAARDYEAQLEAAAAAREQVHRQAVAEEQAGIQSAEEACDLETQRAQAAYQNAIRETKAALAESNERHQQHRLELHALAEQAARLARRRGCGRRLQQLPAPAGRYDGGPPLEQWQRDRAAAEATLHGFQRQWAPQCLAIPWLTLLFFLTYALMIVLGVALDWPPWLWMTVSPVAALGAVLILRVLLHPVVVEQTRSQYVILQQHLADAEAALAAADTLALANANAQRDALRRRLDTELRRAEETRESRRRALTQSREQQQAQAAARYQEQRQQAEAARDARLHDIKARFEQDYQRLQTQSAQQRQELQSQRAQELDACREAFERAWQRLQARWSTGLTDFQRAVDEMNRLCRGRFPSWETTSWAEHQPDKSSLPLLRFGEYAISLAMFERGLPNHPDLAPPQSDFRLPAVMSLSQQSALLWEAFGDGRTVAHRAMQNAMLRFLTALPPGKVRFTIIDPVGLGQSFSAFMHLADFEEKLVNHRIWTDATHIQQRLTDLTEHMEGVIQTFLRNEFQTIAEYNAQAGELAEPLRVLVVANFPAGFSEEAAQRLMSIVASGARCGVYALISTDSKLELPRNFDLADLEAQAATLQWNGRRFHWADPELKDLPLTLDEPPADALLTEIIRGCGQRAKEALRVEVPFTVVAPEDGNWWQLDSRTGLEVALGRAGATKLQRLQLGSGTSQHVLIAGKTGSGKSTLLHALITNTALHYSPDEVQFFLIDFKKGVEFKPYAAHELPHARVVAIESEREFGLSVLQRLDLELRHRGDRFRQAAVQDIRAFRDAHPNESLPRILLIIDEFQEFFVQDDKLAQEAALLLDRLVRQGRAFGIHVLLGSQTLAGSYSLARSTLGQMAIRIALQCSEADSHLILSEDNTAARLLQRPGEAIYNDANGLFEGNHPFQVVWLTAAEQERYLRQLTELAQQRGIASEPAIVFEGNAAADPQSNPWLRRAWRQEEPAGIAQAWLGAAVAIKDPTCVTFRRQSGSNLLLVGQQEEAGLGVLANAVISLAATAPTNGQSHPQFYVLDGSRLETPDTELWKRMASILPARLRYVSPREIDTVIRELSGEVRRRLETSSESLEPMFVVVHHLARFRELRRGDDDFGFSSLDEEKPRTTSQQFVEILRDGPSVGVHVLIWCDTYNTLQRWFDRQTLRDLDQRVLFQMSATDSSNLMDSPLASRLGVHRAILFSEEQGECERFRPYAPPDDAWLEWIRQQAAHRAATRSLA